MNDLQQHTIRIFELAQKVTLHYVANKYKNNFSGNGGDFIYNLRGSIQFRVQAVHWHYVNLLSQHERAESEHLSKIKNDEASEHLLGVLNRQYFLFDDVVFNLISLFEYIGNLVGYFWMGEHGKQKGWPGVANSALDKSNDFSRLGVACTIAAAHRQLFTKLEDYRADIFHYQSRLGGVGTRLEFPTEGNPLRIEIGMSESFKKIFEMSSVESNENELIAYSKHAIIKSFEAIEKVMDHLAEWPIESLHRKNQ